MNTANIALKKVKAAGRKIYRGMNEIIHPFDKYCNAVQNDSWKKYYAKYRAEEPVEENWVFYESHGGSGMLCNPFAIFKAFQRTKEFNDYVHIWAVRDEEEKKRLEDEHSHLKNVYFTFYCSSGYAFFLAKSKYLINNTSYLPVFSKRDNQVYVNTWHSITVKALGYDIPDGRKLVSNMLRNLLMADYVISPNRFMTGIYHDAFRLKEIFSHNFLEIGFPRNDLLINSDREEILRKMERRGTTVDRNKKIILYAPTWNGNSVGRPKIDIARYLNMYKYFTEHIDMDQYQLLIKPHQIEYRNFPQDERESGKYVSYTIDANELLSVVDILITDYSSIYFDYMMADKPILFFMPDFDTYSENRGIYFTKDELPGPCCTELEELATCINNIDEVIIKYESIREKTKSWACEYDDGKVSEKVVDIVFKGAKNYNIKPTERTNKKRLLFYIGQLATNGVTSAALSLLRVLDRDKYDITVFVSSLETPEQIQNFDKIPHDVRTILRTSPPKMTSRNAKLYKATLEMGIPENAMDSERAKLIMQSEYVRSFGNATFDYIIDFSGYGLFFPAIAFLGYAGKNRPQCIIWQHSDMLENFSDSEKMALSNSNTTVEALQSCYLIADKIVSSTRDVYLINRDKLATTATYHKYAYATNLMDTSRISAMINDKSVEYGSDNISIITNKQENGIKNCTVIPFAEKAVHFVTMGRCMPEKNQANIIRAIKRLNDEGVNAVLYIIGDGHLRQELEDLAKELQITKKVIITGIMQNPFALLKRCDCFVFPSIYEAQGLAVLEARAVGLPIIVSNYDAVGSVLLDDKQYILKGTDADAIYEGMMAYIRGEIPADYQFELSSYNKQGIKEFEALIGE